MSTENNTYFGTKFEKEVKILYEGLGYRVEHNSIISGLQTDLSANKYIVGLKKSIHLYIECKFINDGTIGIDNVGKFNERFKLILDSKNSPHYDRGVLITNRGFSPDAKSHGIPNIDLITYNELENEVLNANCSINENIKKYEKEEIYQEYIPLSGSILSNVDKEINFINDIEQWIIHRIQEYKYNDWIEIFSIISDFGGGKTTLLHRLTYQLRKNYLDDNSLYIPVYLELKNFSKYSDFDTYITSSFQAQFNTDIRFDFLMTKINEGKFIFLLDGFDEMSSKINPELKYEYFKVLSKLFLSDSICIISCRPSLFIHHDEFNNYFRKLYIGLKDNNESIYNLNKDDNEQQQLFNKLKKKLTEVKSEYYKFNDKKNIVTIHLEEFNDEQINDYLKKFDSNFKKECNADWVDVKNKLLNMYDLSDVISKPILLFITKEVVLSNKTEYIKLNNINPSRLYQLYTELKLSRDYEKGETRTLLDVKTRNELSKLIALYLYDNHNIVEISNSQIISIINENLEDFPILKERLNEYTIKEIANDIQLCTFITLSTDNNFKFIHKSFIEFFVATYIKDNFRYDNRIKENDIQQEILSFIAYYTYQENNLLSHIKKYYKTINDNNFLKRNLLIIIFLSQNKLTNIEINDILLNNIDLKKKCFYELTFKNITFENITFSEIEIKKCILKDVYFKKIKKLELLLSLCKGEVVFEDGIINKLSISNPKKNKTEIVCKFVNIIIQHLDLYNSNIVLYGDATIESAKIETSYIKFISLSHQIIRNSNFINSLVVNDCEKVSFENCCFNKSLIICKMNFDEIEKNEFLDCIGIIITGIDKKNNINSKKENKSYDKLGIGSKGFIFINDSLLIINRLQVKNNNDIIKIIKDNLENKISESKLNTLISNCPKH